MTEPVPAVTGAQLASVQLPDGRVVQVPGKSNEEIAANLRVMQAREKGEARGKEAGWMPMVDNLVRQFASGASFGGSDEASAALDASTQGMLGRGSDAPNFGQRYNENLAGERGHDEAFHQEHPWLAGGANIAGNIAGAAVALPRAALSAAPTIGRNIFKGATVGAGMAGAQGFGEGEGDFNQRLEHGGTAAMYGGAAGALMPIGGAIGRQAMESGPGRAVMNNAIYPAMDALRGASPQTLAAKGGDRAAESAARDRLAIALHRAGMDPKEAQGRLDRLGDQSVLADVDPAMMREARRVGTMEGESRSHYENVLKPRDMGAGQRMVSALEGNEPPPSSYQLMGRDQAFDEYRRQTGQDAYAEAGGQGLNQSERMRRLYENPDVSGAIDTVLSKNQNARLGTGREPASPVEVMHQVKQQIEGLGQKETGASTPWQQAYRDLAGDYTSALKEANPAIAQADTKYRGAASLPEYYEMGHSLLRKGGSEAAIETSPEALSHKLPLADELQRLSARAGATNAGREASLEGITGARGFARRIEQSQPVQEKLGQLYPQEHANNIVRQAEAEGTFANTSNQLRGGSQTAEKEAEAFGNLRMNIRPSEGLRGFRERLTETAHDVLNHMIEPNEAVRNEIGRTMVNTNSEENRRALALAAELMKRRAQGNPVPVGTAGSLGAQMGRD